MLFNNFNFFIIGAGRGGTSLLAGLLDYHTKLTIGFEYGAVDYLLGQALSKKQAKNRSKRLSAFNRTCRLKAIKHPLKTWGNKITTEQIGALREKPKEAKEIQQASFELFFNQTFPQKKIIFILRDGRACVTSKVKRKNRPMEKACNNWLYSVECFKFLQKRPSNNLCIKFEDLLMDTEKTLDTICDFLNIDFQERMLMGFANKQISAEYQHGKIDISKAIPPKLPEKYFQMIQEELSYCGYI